MDLPDSDVGRDLGFLREDACFPRVLRSGAGVSGSVTSSKGGRDHKLGVTVIDRSPVCMY